MIIPCRRCSCGIYHDASVSLCDECQSVLTEKPFEIINLCDVSPEYIGNVSPHKTFLQSTCPHCRSTIYWGDGAPTPSICPTCNVALQNAPIIPFNKQNSQLYAPKEKEERIMMQKNEPNDAPSQLQSLFTTVSKVEAPGESIDSRLEAINLKIQQHETSQISYEPRNLFESTKGENHGSTFDVYMMPKPVSAPHSGRGISAFARKKERPDNCITPVIPIGVYTCDEKDEEIGPWRKVKIHGMPEMPKYQISNTLTQSVQIEVHNQPSHSMDAHFETGKEPDGKSVHSVTCYNIPDVLPHPPETTSSSILEANNVGTEVAPPIPMQTESEPSFGNDATYQQQCPICNHVFEINSKSKRLTSCPFCRSLKIKFEPVITVSNQPAHDNSLISNTKSTVPQSQQDDDDLGTFGIVEQKPSENTFRAFEMEPTEDTVSGKISFESINHGHYQFSLESGHSLLLGTMADHASFLKQDPRISRRHCRICYLNGYWHVYDNHSSNGTFVNGKDIGDGGEEVLTNGGTLMLGHETDSITFRIKIK